MHNYVIFAKQAMNECRDCGVPYDLCDTHARQVYELTDIQLTEADACYDQMFDRCREYEERPHWWLYLYWRRDRRDTYARTAQALYLWRACLMASVVSSVEGGFKKNIGLMTAYLWYCVHYDHLDIAWEKFATTPMRWTFVPWSRYRRRLRAWEAEVKAMTATYETLGERTKGLFVADNIRRFSKEQ